MKNSSILLQVIATVVISLCSISSHAQNDTVNLTSFEDYHQCFVGFTNDFGDTIWNAQFDDVHSIKSFNGYEEISQLWIVKKGDLYGIIGFDAKISTPIIYEDIQSIDYGIDRFEVSLDGSVGIIDSRNKILIPIEFSEIKSEDQANNFIVQKNKKVGLFNIENGLLLPCEYDNIKKVRLDNTNFTSHSTTKKVKIPNHRFSSFENISPDYYQVQKGKRCGLIDQNGNFIIDVKNKYIKFYDLDAYTYIVPHTGSKKSALLDKAGNTIIPYQKGSIDIQFGYSESLDTLIAILLINNKKASYAVNLHTGVQSDNYLSVNGYGLKTFFKDKQYWGILNEDCEAILIDSNSAITPIFTDILSDDIIYYRSNSILKDPKNSNFEPKIGLFNLRLNTSSPAKYEMIEEITGNSGTFYWAEKRKSSLNMLLDIYDSELNIVKSIVYRPMIKASSLRSYQKRESIIISTISDSLYGAVNERGDTIVPFVYSRCNFRVFDDTSRTNYIIAERNGHFDLFNQDGETIDFGIIRDFNYANGFYEINHGDSSTITDLNFKPFITGVTEFYNAPKLYRDWYRDQSYSENVTYIVKDRIVQFYDKGTWNPLSDKIMDFDTGIRFYNHSFINRQGKIVHSDDFQAKWARGYYILDNDSTGLILDSSGVELNRIQDLDAWNSNKDYLEVKLHSGKNGVLHKTTGEWMVAPIYDAIIPSNKYSLERNQYYWCLVKGDLKEKDLWFIKNNAENIDFGFNQPIENNYQGNHIIQSNSLYGIIKKNSTVKVIVEPLYDTIIKSGSQYLLVLNDQIGIYDDANGIINPEFDAVSMQEHQYGRLIVKDGKLSILDANLNVRKPFQNFDLFKSQRNLVNEIGQKTGEDSLSKFFNANSTEPNAKQILEQHLNLSLLSAQSFYPLSSVLNESINSLCKNHIPYYDTNLVNFSIYPQSFIRNAYSEIVRVTKEISPIDQFRSFHYLNYEIYNDTLRLLHFDDLFSIENHHEFIDSLFLNYLNSNQTYGTRCVDIGQISADLKNQFVFTSGGLRFYFSIPSSDYIEIEYEVLKGVLKERFMND